VQLAVTAAGNVTADTDASGLITAIHVNPNPGHRVRLRVDYLDVQFYDSGWVAQHTDYPLSAVIDPQEGMGVSFDGEAL
jgi:hypothetical protein